MVIKNDPRKVLDLMGTHHRAADPDDEFLDRLAKKTSFYEQPSAPPETLNLPHVTKEEQEAALDGLADVKIADNDDEKDGLADQGEGPTVLHIAQRQDSAVADAQLKRHAEHEKKEARYASLFEGRSAGGSDMTGVPEGLTFEQLKSKVEQQKLPEVGTAAVPAEEARLQQEDEERRAAYIELNRLKEQEAAASEQYKKAHERFVATFGHRGAELKE